MANNIIDLDRKRNRRSLSDNTMSNDRDSFALNNELCKRGAFFGEDNVNS